MLKRYVVKEFYHVPEFRTMGDFDLLTNNIDKSKSIFEENNYSRYGFVFRIYAYLRSVWKSRARQRFDTASCQKKQ